MAFGTIIYEKQGKKAIITINRPERLNAVSSHMSQELHAALMDFRDDPGLWVAILTGAGDRAFCTGADMKELHERQKAALPPASLVSNTPFGGMTKRTSIWKPMIAAINGFAVGGGLEIALACDIRIAADHAELGLPEVRWGLMAAAGGTVRLPRMVPRAVAMKMLLTGQRITAAQALQWGLVTDVAPLAQLMPLAHSIADAVAANAPRAVSAAKEIAVRTLDMALEDGLAFEDRFFGNLVRSADRQEGLRAFLEKRAPVFKGE